MLEIIIPWVIVGFALITVISQNPNFFPKDSKQDSIINPMLKLDSSNQNVYSNSINQKNNYNKSMGGKKRIFKNKKTLKLKKN